jgi:hypothetical protein
LAIFQSEKLFSGIVGAYWRSPHTEPNPDWLFERDWQNGGVGTTVPSNY